MKRLILCVVVVLVGAGQVEGAIHIDSVTVGNVGNTADTTGYGAVNYAYSMGKYEVTAGQYLEFLNAVAATDTYELYNSDMNSSLYGCQITQHGASGSYTYDLSGRPSGAEADWLSQCGAIRQLDA